MLPTGPHKLSGHLMPAPCHAVRTLHILALVTLLLPRSDHGSWDWTAPVLTVTLITSLDLGKDEAVTARITVTRQKTEEMSPCQISSRGWEHNGPVHSRECVLETRLLKALLTRCVELVAWGKSREIFLKI